MSKRAASISPEERMDLKIQELRDATAIANTIHKDIRAERIAVKADIAESKKYIAEIIENEVLKQLKELYVTVERQMNLSVERVESSFKHLENLMTGKVKPDGPTLEQQVSEAVTRGIKLI